MSDVPIATKSTNSPDHSIIDSVLFTTAFFVLRAIVFSGFLQIDVASGRANQ